MACLDTSVLIDMMGRGGEPHQGRATDVVRRLQAQDQSIVTTRFNVAELYVGVERSNDRAREIAKVEASLAPLEILEFDDRAARLFGRFTAELARLGQAAGDMDVLIAAVTVASGHALVTRNAKHFVDIKDLELVAY
jgi:predicted nucleic acid-binding protein